MSETNAVSEVKDCFVVFDVTGDHYILGIYTSRAMVEESLRVTYANGHVTKLISTVNNEDFCWEVSDMDGETLAYYEKHPLKTKADHL